MLFDGWLVLLSLVAQAKNNSPKNVIRIIDALNWEVAIMMGFSIISCNMIAYETYTCLLTTERVIKNTPSLIIFPFGSYHTKIIFLFREIFFLPQIT